MNAAYARVTVDDLLRAATWLEHNEGDADEREPMVRVAEWLRAEAGRREHVAMVRSVARELGVDPRELLKVMRRKGV